MFPSSEDREDDLYSINAKSMSEESLALKDAMGSLDCTPNVGNENPSPPSYFHWDIIDSRYRNVCCMFPNYLWAVIAGALLGSIVFGFSVAVLNTSIEVIARDLEWCGNKTDSSCARANAYKPIASTSLFMGAAVGAMSFGKVSRLGLRRSMLLALTIVICGSISSASSSGFAILVWSRMFMGWGVGLISAITPGMIAEFAPPALRGSFGVTHQISIVVSQSSGIAFGMGLHPSTASSVPFSDQILWRAMMAFAAVPAAIGIVTFAFVLKFESPLFCLKRGYQQDAEEVLKRIYNKPNVAGELAELAADAPSDGKMLNVPCFQALSQPGYTRCIVMGLAISLFQQVTGINAFTTSSNKLFIDAGLEASTATYVSFGVTLGSVIFVLIPYFLLDRWGRRPLLLVSAMGMGISTLPATILYWKEWALLENSMTLTYLAIIGSTLFLAFYAIAVGPVTWVYLFEIFPLDIKATGESLCVAANWISAIVMVFGGGYLPAKVSFSVFTLSSFVYVAFIFVFVRETAGRNLGDSPYVPTKQLMCEGS